MDARAPGLLQGLRGPPEWGLAFLPLEGRGVHTPRPGAPPGLPHCPDTVSSQDPYWRWVLTFLFTNDFFFFFRSGFSEKVIKTLK